MNDCYHYSTSNHTHLTYTPLEISMYEWLLSLFHFEPYAFDVHTTVISMHEWGLLPLFRFESYAFDVHTIVISMHEWPLSSFRFKPCAFDVHTIVISIHEWPLSLFRFESYAFDVHTTVISMHEWLIPLWTIRIWRTHHSNINAWMTVIIIPL